MSSDKQILIIDDLMTVRSKIKKILEAEGFTCIEAMSAEEATGILETTPISLITLDLNLPRENGVDWLKRRREKGMQTPVIIVSDSSPEQANKVFGALENGAQEYIVKSQLAEDQQILVSVVRSLITTQTEKNSQGATKSINTSSFQALSHVPDFILIGSSTGGPAALWKLLENFPQPCPPIVIVQHIPASFTQAFANRLAETSGLSVCEGIEGEIIEHSKLYLSFTDQHLNFKQLGSKVCTTFSSAPKINGHRPSVDSMLFSFAELKRNACAVILTGMGNDGANGIKALHDDKKCYTIAQDQASSAVFGMPARAIETGGIDYVGNLQKIRGVLDIFVKNYNKKNPRLSE